MTKKEKLLAAIKKAKEENDQETLVKIQRVLYRLRVDAADKRDEEPQQEDSDFITTSRAKEITHGREVRTDIPRPNLFIDYGEDKNPNEKNLYVKPPEKRTRKAFKMVDAVCTKCNRSYQVHPTEYKQRCDMEDGQFICDPCIGNRFRR